MDFMQGFAVVVFGLLGVLNWMGVLFILLATFKGEYLPPCCRGDWLMNFPYHWHHKLFTTVGPLVFGLLGYLAFREAWQLYDYFDFFNNFRYWLNK